MSKYRHRLPQLENRLILTDGGLETTLIFHRGLDLPFFAAFHLLRQPAGVAALRDYFISYAELARAGGVGLVLESATWRASADWGRKLGYSRAGLAEANRQSIDLLREIRDAYETERTPIVLSGCVGPRGDGYDPGELMSPLAAEAYHANQIFAFADTDADLVTAMTMTNPAEAIGITRAARAAGLPVAISFTTETDGRLPTGDALGDAILAVDQATDASPAYYMVNCAHPTHFAHVLDDAPWSRRLRGIRANASRRSHAELDEAEDLDAGDPLELADRYAELRRAHPHLHVLGGCCGTDHRHIAEIYRACVTRPDGRVSTGVLYEPRQSEENHRDG
ncbi:MAG: homocysteine S-methyltransferase family protein [Thermoanaerobaculia bacterium]